MDVKCVNCGGRLELPGRCVDCGVIMRMDPLRPGKLERVVADIVRWKWPRIADPGFSENQTRDPVYSKMVIGNEKSQ
jgi:hypothetical protein